MTKIKLQDINLHKILAAKAAEGSKIVTIRVDGQKLVFATKDVIDIVYGPGGRDCVVPERLHRVDIGGGKTLLMGATAFASYCGWAWYCGQEADLAKAYREATKDLVTLEVEVVL